MTGQPQPTAGMDPARKQEMARLDSLIQGLEERVDTAQGLMREHLTEARSYLLGSMDEEYAMTLDVAKEILPQIEPPELRRQIGAFLLHRN